MTPTWSIVVCRWKLKELDRGDSKKTRWDGVTGDMEVLACPERMRSLEISREGKVRDNRPTYFSITWKGWNNGVCVRACRVLSTSVVGDRALSTGFAFHRAVGNPSNTHAMPCVSAVFAVEIDVRLSGWLDVTRRYCRSYVMSKRLNLS